MQAAVRSAINAPLFPAGKRVRTQKSAAMAADNAALVLAYQAEMDEEKKQAYMRELVECNMRLVHTVAREYQGMLEHSSFDYDDLVQEGVFGLYRAAEKFDPAQGASFSSYAVIWIRSVIGRALRSLSPVIRISYRQAESITKISRAKSEFISEHGRQPTEQELMERTGLTKEQMTAAWLAYTRMNPISLDEHLMDEDDDITLSDTLASDTNVHEEALCDPTDQTLLEAIKKILPEKEFDIVCRRNAIGPYETRQTFVEISQAYGISRQRVEQIEKIAYRRLRKKINDWSSLL